VTAPGRSADRPAARGRRRRARFAVFWIFCLCGVIASLRAAGLQCDYAGWAVTGIGLATVVPAVFSAVGERDAGVRRALSWVAVCAYAGELAGSAVIGPLAGATSLWVATPVPAALAVFIAAAGPVAVLRAAPGGTSPGARSRR